jgi:hypothetical protein
MFEHPKAVAVLLITAKPFQNRDAESLRGRHTKMASWQEASVCIHANLFHVQHFLSGETYQRLLYAIKFATDVCGQPLVKQRSGTCSR